ncbi:MULTISPECIES: exonuclease [unclassified Marinobacter]|uniref:exonuclease n=1 Tax=unclassified Marinobacter TaxID=83889 RepID=UPI001267E678|nr:MULTISPECIES: exonuclease [unclassified Marinobacter]QFS87599.1 DNA polymerase I [Marinobacter sp. THAF197a]QFT51384.1 DNA polymerase I [Marinobacter sp. THAF39]
MSETILLMDGDIFAFEAASVVEQEIDWGDGLWTLHSFFEDAFDHAVRRMEDLKKQLNADTIVFCWSDPAGRYWRHDVLPTYKQSRKGGRKPLALRPLKEALAEKYESFMRPGLEADDVMGILSTWDGYKPGAKKIIVSIDKDMKTIPGWLFNPQKDYQPWEVSKEEADYWHMFQTLMGDATDGYDGCPGIGPVIAEKHLTEVSKVVSYAHELKSGKRKGEIETRWTTDEADDLWDVVVSLFNKQGLCEEEALRQARVARILQANDYDFHAKEVKLWTPEK